MTDRPLRATYRLQLGPDTGFAQAADLVGHLLALGISHLYLSPITEAEPDSAHGYDVTDHAAVRRQLGGPSALRALASAATMAGIGLVVDTVPNHTAIGTPRHNRRWWETLQFGRHHESARFFDVDWAAQDDKVLLPVLTAPLDDELAAGRLAVATLDGEAVLRYGDQPDGTASSDGEGGSDGGDGGLSLPLAPGTEGRALPDLLAAQHYRLVRWERRERNLRRFFVVDSLAAVRAEDDLVADEVNTVPRRLWAAGAADGIRVDHVDGLAEPGRYLDQLRRDAPAAWIVVEKILAPDERLPPSWPVQGTTGYDFLRLVDHVLVDPAGEASLTELWQEISGDTRTFDNIARQARREVLAGPLAPDLARVTELALAAWPDADPGRLSEAVATLTVEIDRYRTYLGDDPTAPTLIDALAVRAVERRADLAAEIEAVAELLVSPTSPDGVAFATRWQQLTAPVVAKGDEDCAYYRYHRLAALCEVGGEPGRFGFTPADFHADAAWRAEHLPRSMLAGSTHDTKRSEDVRARLLTLAEVPEQWRDLIRSILPHLTTPAASDQGDEPAADSETGSEPDAGDSEGDSRRVSPAHLYLAVQTAVGAWPLDTDRLHAYLIKAAREAAIDTHWTEPDTGYEAGLGRLAGRLTDPGTPVAEAVAAFVAGIAGAGWSNSLAQVVLRLTAPGVPDVYQGTETWSLRLVDPDNRVEPDWVALAGQVEQAGTVDIAAAWAQPADGLVKTAVITRALSVRARRPGCFEPGSTYTPVTVEGPQADHALAYLRGPGPGDGGPSTGPSTATAVNQVLVAVTRFPLSLDPAWTGTTLAVPTGTWRNALQPDLIIIGGGPRPVAQIFAGLPVAVWEREQSV